MAATRARADFMEQTPLGHYVGRGLVLGVTSDGGHIVQALWISGRSQRSKARFFAVESTEISTQMLAGFGNSGGVSEDVAYTAMARCGLYWIVGNGAQTKIIARELERGGTPTELGAITRSAPPAVVDCPRISGVSMMKDNRHICFLAIVKPTIPVGVTLTTDFRYENVPSGIGYCISTYMPVLSEDVPRPFCGEPFAIPLAGTAKSIAAHLWDSLDSQTKVGIVCRVVDLKDQHCQIATLSIHGPSRELDMDVNCT
jgi:IMP cyclohydrolase